MARRIVRTAQADRDGTQVHPHLEVTTVRPLPLLLLLAACTEPATAGLEGAWHGWLRLQGTDLPFQLELDEGLAVLHNGAQRVRATRHGDHGQHLELRFAGPGSHIEARLTTPGRLEGHWQAPNGERLPLFAERTAPILPTTLEPLQVAGRWTLAGADRSSVALFSQAGSALAGTVLSPLGDAGYLTGFASTDGVRMSGFDGAQAVVLSAALGPAGELVGELRRDGAEPTSWTATRDSTAPTPDGFGLTRPGPGTTHEIVLPDLSGRLRRLDEPELRGRARVLLLLQTGSPRSADAARLLIELHQRLADSGLAVAAIVFETGEPEQDRARAARFAEHYRVPFPVLLGGRAEPKPRSGAFGLVDTVLTWPTLLFLDADDRVVATHSGFAGPASGQAHHDLVRRIQTTVEALLAAGTIPKNVR